MGEIYLHYPSLEDSINYAKKVRNEITDYSDELEKKITKPISNLKGTDANGYTATASSLAYQKINALVDKSEQLSAFESSVTDLISTSKTKDEYVSSQIETISGMYIEKRSFLQSIGDGIYNLFCVDLANSFDLTRGIVNHVKSGLGFIGGEFEKVKEWFTNGDGRYILNVAGAVTDVVLSVITLGAALASIPLSGGSSTPLSVPLIVGTAGAVVAGISAIITVVNSDSKIKMNNKAYQLHNSGDISVARYYGNIEKLSDEWDKTDKGDASANNFFSEFGNFIDTTKKYADNIGLITGFASYGFKKDYRYNLTHADKFDFSLDNIKKNIRGELGLYITKPGIKEGTIFNVALNAYDIVGDVKDFANLTIDFVGDAIGDIFTPQKIFSNIY